MVGMFRTYSVFLTCVLALHATLGADIPAVAPTVNPSECRSLIDLYMVIDGSDSISKVDFIKLQDAIDSLIPQIDLGENRARIGMLVYSSHVPVTSEHPFSSNAQYLKTAAATLEHPRDGTNTQLGINHMREMFKIYGRKNVPWVAVVLTDGISKDPALTKLEADAAARDGINMFAVGIGHRISLAELGNIASSQKQVLTIENFDQLRGVLASMMTRICPCPVPPSLPYAKCADGARAIGTVRNYQCMTGYLQRGNGQIMCQDDFTWTPLAADFQCVPCSDTTPDVQYGTCGGGDVLIGSRRQFTCLPGYMAVGNPDIVCQDDAMWSIPQFQCVPCGETPVVPNGVCGGGEYKIGSLRQFTCLPGYLAIGNAEIRCLDNAQWTTPNFQCVPCGETPVVPNGVCGGGDYTIGSLRQFTCLPGYLAVGNAEIRCMDNAQWTTPNFQCVPCGDTPVIPNGICGGGDDTIGALRHFTCNPGYLAVGNAQIKCLPNAKWSVPDFKCMPCGDTPVVPNGVCGGGDYTIGSLRQFTCLPGYLAVGNAEIRCLDNAQWTTPNFQCVPCGDTPVIPNGVCGGGDYTIGALRHFTCNPGYLAVGNAEIKCLANAQWSVPDFKCMPCGDTPVIPNGVCGGGDYTIGAQRQYICDDGYLQVGNPGITCDANAQWTTPQVQCIPCGDTPVIPNGVCGGGDFTIGALRHFTCNPGYLAVGNAQIQCLPNAKWSIPDFQCMPCGDTPVIANGVCGGGDYTIGSLRQFTCNPGYLAVGNNEIMCLDNAQWSLPGFKCIPCGDTPVVPNGVCGGGDYTIGSLRQFTCNQGYLPVGNAEIKCLPNAQWAVPDFQCVPCGETPVVPNGVCGGGDYTIGSLRQFTCLPGYLAVGNAEIRCLDNAQWTTPNFQCVPCGDTPVIPNGVCGGGDYTIGALRHFTCNPGYLAVGNAEIKCLANAQWSVPDFKCMPCGDTPVIPNGVCGGGDYTIGAQRQYICDDGYLQVGNPGITCDVNAQWTAPQVQCIPCGETPLIDNGFCDGGLSTIGARREYKCLPGYLAVGSPFISCNAQAQWTMPDFQCIPCGETPTIAHGTCGGGDYTLGATRMFTCEPGYKPEGDPMITCLNNALWSKPTFRCVPCGDTPVLPHASCGGNGYTIGTVRTYTCATGYLPVGNPNIECLATAMWSEPSFQCTACGATPTIVNGICADGDVIIGARRQLSCAPGYKPDGDAFITCGPDAQWTTPLFRCVPCGDTPLIENAVCSGGDVLIGTQRTYTCNPGYLAVGNPHITCDVNAQWTLPDFQCKPCGDTPVVDHATCGGGDYLLGSRRTFTCANGYALIGNADIECLADATWSIPDFVCSLCGDTPTIPNADCSGGDYTVGTKRLFTCHNGFVPQGNPEIMCLDNGMWSTPSFECLGCGPAPAVPNAYYGIGPGTIGSTLEYYCDAGYEMYGRGQITCLPSGVWQAPTFSCNVRTTTTTTVRPPIPNDPSVCDACRYINGVGYNTHPFDCNQYVQCFIGTRGMEPVYRRCPFGQFWDQNVLTCRPSDQVDCVNDKCKGQMTGAYKHSDPNSCCSYWKCDNGRSYGECCGEGFSFSEREGRCVYDDSCDQECEYDDELPACDKRPSAKDTYYEQHIGNNVWVSMPCAPGTAYNPVDCQCSLALMTIPGKTRQQVCKPELYLPFTNGFADSSGKNVYVMSENVTIINGAAQFNGHSRLLINRFSNTEFVGDLVIRFRYSEFRNGPYFNQLQALVTNGDCGSDPSIVVAKMPGYVLLGAKTDTPKSFALPTLDKEWKDVIYMHDERRLEGRVCGASMSKWSYGPIAATHCGLQIGQGHGLKSYHGLIDDLYIYQCRPRASLLNVGY